MEKAHKGRKKLRAFVTDETAALDARLCNDDESTLHDYIVSMTHSNGSPLVHHADKADGFTCGFVVFPENGVKAETRTAMIPSQVSQETNREGDHWFTAEAIEKMQQIT